MAALFLGKSGVITQFKPIFIYKSLTNSKLFFSTSSNKNTAAVSDDNVKKSVFISQSNDIFSNLALEDWIYRNEDLSKHHILLIWRNTPCVVIGRHQNPWLEANLDYLAAKGIELVRRNSGGGAVYHDRGNLNMTFFTPRDRYNRKANLEVIKKALFREWKLNVEISPRDDLLLNNYHKVSGTASKLGRTTAYHHCTLLISSDRNNLSQSLIKNNDEIETKATRSVPSRVDNLQNGNPMVSPERMLSAVGWEYLRTKALSLEDGGTEQISKQRGFQLINPTDQWFPGLAAIRDEFLSWEWRFGKTPRFIANRHCAPHADLRLNVQNGTIVDVSIRISNTSVRDVTKIDALPQLNGHRYTSNTLNMLERAFLRTDGHLEKMALRV